MYAKMKRIVENQQSEVVNGYLVDLYSASVFCAIYKNLDELRREKLRNLGVKKAIELCYEIISASSR